jgi:dihydroorotate dehydrogenase
LAAGFDKDASCTRSCQIWFWFYRNRYFDTKGQEGNPKKRLFRLKEDSAIINRMGFNNGGVLKR